MFDRLHAHARGKPATVGVSRAQRMEQIECQRRRPIRVARVVEEKFVEKRREESFSTSRREENGAERDRLPPRQPEGASGGERKAERAQCPTSNAEDGKEGRGLPTNPDRREANFKISIPTFSNELSRHHTKVRSKPPKGVPAGRKMDQEASHGSGCLEAGGAPARQTGK